VRKNHALAAVFIEHQAVNRAESSLQAASGAVWSVSDDVSWSDSSSYGRSNPSSIRVRIEGISEPQNYGTRAILWRLE
jgi:hypothetical protein